MKKDTYSILYEDENIIAVNKASGISVGGERWEIAAERLDKLLGKLLAEREQSQGAEFLGKKSAQVYTIHRIDKETSGLVVFAKDPEIHKKLSAAFESRLVEKTYTAVIHGRPSWPESETDCALPLIPDGDKKHRTIVDKYKGKPSITHFRLLLAVGNYSVVEARPATGRTHQIRVHLSAMEHPIVCDPLYGKNRRTPEKGIFLSSFKRNWRGDALEERPLISRLALHAAHLVLPYGDSGQTLVLEAPLPKDMAALIKQMEKINS
jgi:RluA family pseudouridine synthase